MALNQAMAVDYNHLGFSSCDRCTLSLLRPHLAQADKQHPGCSQIQQLLRQFKQALDQKGVISLTIEGQVQVMTPQAEHLLSQYLDYQGFHILPDCLEQWFKQQISRIPFDRVVPPFGVPLHIKQSGQQLIIRLIPDPFKKCYLLLLEEQELPSFSISTLESLGLTQREAEVLFWVAKDKSNVEIGKILDSCEGTVRKHLEHLYKKLGVQTRMGAVMTALERLGLLQV